MQGSANPSTWSGAAEHAGKESSAEESGAVWIERLLAVYHNAIWLNPQPEAVWDYHESIRITRQLMGERMFPLTLEGLDRGMRALSKAN